MGEGPPNEGRPWIHRGRKTVRRPTDRRADHRARVGAVRRNVVRRRRLLDPLAGYGLRDPLAITLAYFVLLEGAVGATIGKVVLGMRVRRLDGAHRSRRRRDPQPGSRRRRVPVRDPVLGRRHSREQIRHEATARRPMGEDGGDPGGHRCERRRRAGRDGGGGRPVRAPLAAARCAAGRPEAGRFPRRLRSRRSYQRGSRESSAARPVHSVPEP